MPIKIKMLNVGDADAIVVQLRKNNEQLNIVVDGGRSQSHADRIIDYFEDLRIRPQILICTHLDQDHIGGLGYILEKYHQGIQGIWTHLPEKHEPSFKSWLKQERVVQLTHFGKVDERTEQLYASVQDLENFVLIAERFGLKHLLFEPFSDETQRVDSFCDKWGIKILGPSASFYTELVPHFHRAYKKQLYEYEKAQIDPCSRIGKEGYDRPENESSLIFKISDGGKDYLFTGDAGLMALGKIADKLGKIYWLKVPHHGSRENLNEELIRRLSPAVCHISADGRNGHPDENLIACLRAHKAATVRCTGLENSDLVEEG